MTAKFWSKTSSFKMGFSHFNGISSLVVRTKWPLYLEISFGNIESNGRSRIFNKFENL